MFARPTIFVLLTASTFFGPLACCCAWSKTLEAFSPRPHACQTSPATTAPSCPYCHGSGGHSAHASPCPDHREPSPKCPCCESRQTDTLTADTGDSTVEFAPIATDLLPVTPDFSATHRCVLLGSHPDSINDRQTFLTDFCHRLRC